MEGSLPRQASEGVAHKSVAADGDGGGFCLKVVKRSASNNRFVVPFTLNDGLPSGRKKHRLLWQTPQDAAG